VVCIDRHPLPFGHGSVDRRKRMFNVLSTWTHVPTARAYWDVQFRMVEGNLRHSFRVLASSRGSVSE